MSQHNWGDSNLYLRRKDDELQLATEHRGEPGRDDLTIELLTDHDTLRLCASERAPPQETHSAKERLLQTLAAAHTPMTARELRERSRMRTQSLGEVLRQMQTEGTVVHTDRGYCIPRQR